MSGSYINGSYYNPYICNYSQTPCSYGEYNPFKEFQQYMSCDTLNYDKYAYNGKPAAEQEASLASQCKTNLAIMGGIKVIPLLRHPGNNIAAISDAWKTYSQYTDALKGLSEAQKGNVFTTLYNYARLQPRVTTNTEYVQRLTNLRAEYLNALRTGKSTRIAKAGAKLTTFTEKGISGHIFNRTPSVDSAMKSAIGSANTTGKAVMDAQKALKGVTGMKRVCGIGKQWFKEGGGWFAVALEALGQLPELIAAYSEGKRGDGLKQTAKSATTVGINVAGWIAGSKIGAIAGTKIGAIIGSFFGPGPGTAIGAAIGGFVGGIIGMAVGNWSASKISKAVVGKSFKEKQAEMKAKEEQLLQQQAAAQQSYQPTQFNPYYVSNPFYNYNTNYQAPYYPYV